MSRRCSIKILESPPHTPPTTPLSQEGKKKTHTFWIKEFGDYCSSTSTLFSYEIRLFQVCSPFNSLDHCGIFN